MFNLLATIISDYAGSSSAPLKTSSNTSSYPGLWIILIGVAALILLAVVIIATIIKSHNIKKKPLNTNTLTTANRLIPITCPVCGSKNIAFTEEYHKAIILKIISDIFLIAIIILSAYNLTTAIASSKDFDYQSIILVCIIYIVIRFAMLTTESKTHTKGICRDCGYIWLLD